MKKLINVLFFLLIISISYSQDEVVVKPQEFEGALRNPMKGFTTTNVQDHPWATLTHTYIRWNELENHETDGIEKIIRVSNEKWKNAAAKNMKVIPRVYLHWSGEDEKYWPEDMQEDDYTSEQFQARVLRLIERLGICWDNDPRVAFIEMGIFGKWGEQHSPFPTAKMEKLVGEAFAKAFKNKKVSVRRNWERFTENPFGEYWDSWAHYDQMWEHGGGINRVNEETDRYKHTYVGGEVAYNWGNSDIQAGPSPTASVAIEKHRNFVINSIRWLHCTQLRWITAYDTFNHQAVAGAKEIQKVFGYRYVIDEVRFSLNDSLRVSFDVTNTGSAPFYYDWPIEVALLDSVTHEPVWKAKMDSVDIRKWLPGEGWTEPEWKYVGSWQEYHPNVNWNPSDTTEWATPPAMNTVEDKFKIDLPDGDYILSLSILDPAGELPSIKFATNNYLKGGRHPIGLVHVGENTCDTLPGDFQFDNPGSDNTLFYDDDFEVVYEREPEQTPFTGDSWIFPTDTVSAWQYDFINNFSGEKYFSLDSSHTIGVYGCNNTTGINIRSYNDSIQHKDAAQFRWNQSSETFQKNGQWVEYTADFKLNLPYQLYLRARKDVDANFKLTILTTRRDTVSHRNFNLQTDFTNEGEGNEQTDWFLSKMAIPGLWGSYTVRFDWYDNVGEPGIFGGFAFVRSDLDVTPPEWYFVSVGTLSRGTDIVVMTTENAKVYLVPEGTPADSISIKNEAVAVTYATAYSQHKLATSGLEAGDYVVYAIDASNNVSAVSPLITLTVPVNAQSILNNSDIFLSYKRSIEEVTIKSSNRLKQINVFNILGKKVKSIKGTGNNLNFSTSGFNSGIYIIQVFDNMGINFTSKISKD